MNEDKKKNQIQSQNQNQIAKAEQYEGQAQQWAELFDNHNNTMERIVQEKHVFRVGALSIEISPDGETSVMDMMEAFKDFATHMHSLHKDEHLKMTFKNEGDGEMPLDEVNGGLYS